MKFALKIMMVLNTLAAMAHPVLFLSQGREAGANKGGTAKLKAG